MSDSMREMPSEKTPRQHPVSDEQVKGIPMDLQQMYEASKLDTTMFVGSEIRELIGRVARSEQALADQYHAASQFADAIVRMDAEKVKHEQALAALEARNKELESPVSFSEAEAVLDLPMNMEKFIEHVDFANNVLTRRITINRERAALKGAS